MAIFIANGEKMNAIRRFGFAMEKQGYSPLDLRPAKNGGSDARFHRRL